MYWANFLHIYQPHGQQPDVLEAIVAQSYRPLVQGLLDHPEAKLTLNVNGSLLELFDRYGYHDLIEKLQQVGRNGQVEFTASAKYHALLPFLSAEEALRQIEVNTETSRHYLGDAYQPRGIFLPEMAYDPKLNKVLEKAGLEWVILDEIAHEGQVDSVDYTKLYQIKDSKLKVFFRERRMSNLIMSAVVRSKEQLEAAMREDMHSDRYIVTGMDGETFGHHRPGLEQLLFQIFASPELHLVRLSDLLELYKDQVETTNPAASTWASSEQDIRQGIQFLSWSDPENEIHRMQWQLRDLVVDEFHKLASTDPAYDRLRHLLDIALASDQFFWASAKPWWSVDQIEEGAYNLLHIIESQPDVPSETLSRARQLYHEINSTALTWKRTGKVVEMQRDQNAVLRIPFRERTYEQGGRERKIYEAFIDMMRDQEHKAAATGAYEAAIVWRDAIYRIEHKTDIYEAIHAVDLLRTKLPNDEIERTLDKYTAEYRRIRGGQPEQRGA
jgi:hypothetical protein